MICPHSQCNGALVVVDSRHKMVSRKEQFVQRNYCCVECGRRYRGMEILNTQSYNQRTLPNNKLRMLGLID